MWDSYKECFYDSLCEPFLEFSEENKDTYRRLKDRSFDERLKNYRGKRYKGHDCSYVREPLNAADTPQLRRSLQGANVTGKAGACDVGVSANVNEAEIVARVHGGRRAQVAQNAADIQIVAHRALPNPSLRDVADRRRRPGRRTPRSHNALGLLGGLAQGQDKSTTLRA